MMNMMILKTEKINQAGKGDCQSLVHPAPAPKTFVLELLLRIHKVWVFVQRLLQGSI